MTIPVGQRHTAPLLVGMRRIWVLTWMLLVIMSASRAMFLLLYAHPELWEEQFRPAVWAAFLLGMLHDVRSLLYILLPLTLSLLWMRDREDAGWRRWLRWASRYSFLSVTVVLITLGADQIYYAHFQSHINILAWAAFEDDLGAILRGALRNYPVLPYALLVLLLATFIWLAVSKAFRPEGILNRHDQPSVAYAERWLNIHLVTHVLCIAVLSIGVLTPAGTVLEANLKDSPIARAATGNGLEGLFEAVWTRATEKPYSVAAGFGYGRDLDAAIDDFTAGNAPTGDPDAGVLERLPLQLPAVQPPVRETPPHVLLVVMESLATHLLERQSPEFDLLGPLARHRAAGVSFERFLPSDNGSAGSILALTLDLPYRPGTMQLSQSDARVKEFPASTGRRFQAHGYETAFIYGGPLEWRELDRFLPLQGFDRVIGQDDIVRDRGLDPLTDVGDWGVWDEHLWSAVRDHLRAAEGPQFVIVFTTTNHRPHELPGGTELPELVPPAELLERSGELSTVQRKQFRTYQYANYRLGEFLDGMEEDGLLADTVIGVTGDHTSGMGIPFASTEALHVRGVPFLLLMPPATAAAFEPDPLRPGSHKDVVPTLLHAAGLSRQGYRGLGSSLLDHAATPLGFNASGLLIHSDGAVQLRGDVLDAYTWVGDSLKLRPSVPGPEALDARRRYQAAMAIADWLVYEDLVAPE